MKSEQKRLDWSAQTRPNRTQTPINPARDIRKRALVAIHMPELQQGNRVWKFEREECEHSANSLALSLRSWSGFGDFRSRFDETDPNAIALRITVQLAPEA